MTRRKVKFVLLPKVAEEQPRLLLEAYAQGLYAAKAGNRTDNPYRDDPQMAAAWQQGWEGKVSGG